MARLEKLEGDIAKRDNLGNGSTTQVAAVSTPNSSNNPLPNNPLPSGEDIHMASATEVGSETVMLHKASHAEDAATTKESISNEGDSSSMAKDAEERGQEPIEFNDDEFEGDDVNMYDDDKGTKKQEGKKVTGRKHRRAALNNDDDEMTAESDSDSDKEGDDEDDEDDGEELVRCLFVLEIYADSLTERR